jgi:hypothetical protein
MSDHANGAKWNQFISNLINIDDEIAYLGWLAELHGFYEYTYLHHFEIVDVIESELDKILEKHKGCQILGSYISKKGNEIVKIERPLWVKGYFNSSQI